MIVQVCLKQVCFDVPPPSNNAGIGHSVNAEMLQNIRNFLLSHVPPPWASDPASLDPEDLSIAELLDLLQVALSYFTTASGICVYIYIYI